MIVLFTGPAELSEWGMKMVHAQATKFVSEECGPDSEFRSGCASGVDSVSAVAAMRAQPRAKHVLFVPGEPAWSNLDFVLDYAKALEVRPTVIECPAKDTASQAFMARNTAMVEHLPFPDLAVAWTPGPEVKRSGTWSTVRRARARSVPIREHRLPRAALP